MKTWKIGIIGMGKQGTHHAQSIWKSPDYEVALFFDAGKNNEEEIQEFSKSSGIRQAGSMQELLATDLHLVVIATPSHQHFEAARQALEFGKNVLIEKPTALSLSDTDALIGLSEKHGCALLTHFNRRFDPDFIHLKDVLLSGRLGRIHHLESRVSETYDCSSTYPRRSEWKKRRPAGGILWDWAPHLFDQLFDLFPDEAPIKIFCHGSRPNKIVDEGLEEQFVVSVLFDTRLSIIGATWNAALPLPRWYAVGESGTLRIEQAPPIEGAIRYRSGSTVCHDVLAESDRSLNSYTSLIPKILSKPKALDQEKRRMRQVSYAIDLAKLSAKTKTIVEWDQHVCRTD